MIIFDIGKTIVVAVVFFVIILQNGCNHKIGETQAEENNYRPLDEEIQAEIITIKGDRLAEFYVYRVCIDGYLWFFYSGRMYQSVKIYRTDSPALPVTCENK